MCRIDYWLLIGLAVAGALACNSEGDSKLLSPCRNPAPLNGELSGLSPEYIIQYREGIDAVVETERLARIYAFEPVSVYGATHWFFSADLTAAQLDGVRCEPSVAAVYHNKQFYPNSGSS